MARDAARKRTENRAVEALGAAEEATAQAAQPQQASSGLPPGWVEAIDPASGKMYYSNTQSGLSSWVLPQPQPPQQPQPAQPQQQGFHPQVRDEVEKLRQDLKPKFQQAQAQFATAQTQAQSSPKQIQPQVQAQVQARAEAKAAARAKNSLPPGWRLVQDPSSGQTYYASDKTGESIWTVPEVSLPPPPAAAQK